MSPPRELPFHRSREPTFTPSDLHRADFFQDGAMSAMTFLTWSFDESIAGHTVDRLHERGDVDEGTTDRKSVV